MQESGSAGYECALTAKGKNLKLADAKVRCLLRCRVPGGPSTANDALLA